MLLGVIVLLKTQLCHYFGYCNGLKRSQLRRMDTRWDPYFWVPCSDLPRPAIPPAISVSCIIATTTSTNSFSRDRCTNSCSRQLLHSFHVLLTTIYRPLGFYPDSERRSLGFCQPFLGPMIASTPVSRLIGSHPPRQSYCASRASLCKTLFL